MQDVRLLQQLHPPNVGACLGSIASDTPGWQLEASGGESQSLRGHLETSVHAGVKYSDPGATAADNVDGNVTSQLSSFGVGAVVTTRPTAAASPFVITYNVKDSAGNAAPTARRRVNVVCPAASAAAIEADCNMRQSLDDGARLCLIVATVHLRHSKRGTR